MLEPLFDELPPDAVEQEVTQKDQFNTDEVKLAETLVRESLQNSIDARRAGEPTVRVRIFLKKADGSQASLWRALLEPLRQHLRACDVPDPSDLEVPSVLVIEDFGTTGLTGSVEVVDGSNFHDFWRRIGKSHKAPGKNGSWGLGKIVFPASSEIQTFFGLTVRDDDPGRTLLMGQSVLQHHHLNGKKLGPVGLFALKNEGIRVPTGDEAFNTAFKEACGMVRTVEPGLSIAIPHVKDGLDPDALLPYAIRNYFFPILTGRLQVEIGSHVLTAENFASYAAQHGGETLAAGHLIAFIRDIHAARTSEPDISLQSDWADDMERAMPPERLADLREKYALGALVHTRLPISLTSALHGRENGAFDLFIQRAPEGVRGQALFIRGSITVPNESIFFRSGQAFGALIASEAPVTSFLRDAENPAHTRWNGQAERLRKNWKSAHRSLSQIRNSLQAIHDLLARAVERTDTDALIDIIAIPASGVQKPESKPKHVATPPVPPVKPSPKRFAIARRQNGFAVRAGKDLVDSDLPLHIRVRAAYDVIRGNPFARHRSLDFDFTKAQLVVSSSGANVSAVAPNELLIEAADPSFEVAVSGFDTNRDLVVKANL